ncbi:MAG: hypothetical protein IPK59_18720 [Rhodospirillaceae bacterium]|nr:hypothetical protein [Rhodospirillaceae bacterium]
MIFDPILDLFRGKAVTIPPLDGAFRPNMVLDEAQVQRDVAAPDNLCAAGGRILFSSGPDLHQMNATSSTILANFEASISAIALAQDGLLALALDNGRLFVGDNEITLPDEMRCLTALCFGQDNMLYACNGSSAHKPSDWVMDLMAANALGSIWQIDLARGKIGALATGLAFPHGLMLTADGRSLLVAESWKHRLLRVPLDGTKPIPVLEKLPGYPARLSPARDGGAWLSLFAPRNRLVEFVLQEPAYLADMLQSVPRPYWIAPSLSSGTSFLEPLQCGGIKTMGIHKPWSPSRSYGLAARLDSACRPVTSFHSRANGNRHGVTSVVEIGTSLLVGAKGGDVILDVDLSALVA